MSDAPAAEAPGNEWDPLAAEALADPFAVHRNLRARCPVPHSQRWGGFYALTRYADVVEASRNSDTFTATVQTVIPASPKKGLPRLPLQKDPPEHGHYRRGLNTWFKESKMRLLEPRLVALAASLYDRLLRPGTVDFSSGFAAPFTQGSLCLLIGLDIAEAERLGELSHHYVKAVQGEDLSTAGGLSREVDRFAVDLVADRKAAPHDPRTDMVTGLLQTVDEGRPYTEVEVAGMVRMLLIGGHVVPKNFLGSIAHLLATDQAVQRRLRREPSLIRSGIEEMLRMYSANQALVRVTTKRRRDRRTHDTEGQARGAAFPVGQSRRGGVRQAGRVRPRAQAQPPYRIRHRPACVHRPVAGAHAGAHHAGAIAGPHQRLLGRRGAGLGALDRVRRGQAPPRGRAGRGGSRAMNRPPRPADFVVPEAEDFDGPHALFRELRGRCPVAYANDLGGFWAVTKHADIVRVLTEWQTFTTATQNVVPPVATTQRRPPLHLDPPDNIPYRNAILRFLTPQRVAAWEPRIRAMVGRYLGPLVARGHGDICADFSFILPIAILAEFFRIPAADAERIRIVGAEFNMALQVQDFDLLRQKSDELYRIARDLIADRQANPQDPDEDPTASLLAVRVDGEPLRPDLILGALRQFLLVGIIAPTTFIASMAVHLARHRELHAELRAHRDRIPAAMEELLRLYTPYRGFARTARHDVELGGRHVKAGDALAVVFTSGNRDETVFDRPDEFRFDRDRSLLLTFGRGPHMCPGAPLARLQLQIGTGRTHRADIPHRARRRDRDDPLAGIRTTAGARDPAQGRLSVATRHAFRGPS